MKKSSVIVTFVLLALVLAACGAEEGADADRENGAVTPAEQPPPTEGMAAVGGFTVEGPDGEEIVIPEATVEREAVESYLDEVRPVIEETQRDLSTVVDPQARIEDDALRLSIGLESIDEAKDATEDGLERLREIEPPEELEPIHQQLVTAYEEALPAYENIIEAFDSGDVEVLAGAARENLPRVEQSIAKSNTILQELQRAASQDAPAAQER